MYMTLWKKKSNTREAMLISCFLSILSTYLYVTCTVIAPAMSGSSVASGNWSGSILLNFDSEEHQGVSRMQQQQRLGETETMNCFSLRWLVMIII